MRHPGSMIKGRRGGRPGVAPRSRTERSRVGENTCGAAWSAAPTRPRGEQVIREGGLLTSLTDSDGLVERPDATTMVAPGDMLAAYPHALPW